MSLKPYHILFSLVFLFNFLGVQCLFEGPGVEVVDVAIGSRLEPLQQLLFDLVVDPGGDQSLLLSPFLTSFHLLLDGDQLLLTL